MPSTTPLLEFIIPSTQIPAIDFKLTITGQVETWLEDRVAARSLVHSVVVKVAA